MSDEFEYDVVAQLLPGENVIAIQKVGKKIYAFTPQRTYVLRKLRWYERLAQWWRQP